MSAWPLIGMLFVSVAAADPADSGAESAFQDGGIGGIIEPDRRSSPLLADSVLVRGSLSPSRVETFVREASAPLYACVRASEGRNGGDISLRLLVAADGHVSEAAIFGSDLPDAVAECVRVEIEQAAFGTSLGEDVSIELTLRFPPAPGARPPGPSGALVGIEAAAGLEVSAIEPVLERFLSPIRYCYQRVAARGTTDGGSLVVHVAVGPSGRVTDASVSTGSTLGHEEVRRCVVARFGRMAFPEPTTGAATSFDAFFAFDPGPDAHRRVGADHHSIGSPA